MPWTSRNIIERFWEKVRRGPECWVWTAGKYSNGYGQFIIPRELTGRKPNGREHTPIQAHKVIYLLLGVKYGNDLVVDHLCKNKLCVRPDHLRLATHWQNVCENSVSPVAHNSRKTHCKNGHPLTKRPTSKKRYCKICTAANLRSNRVKNYDPLTVSLYRYLQIEMGERDSK